MNRTEAVAIGLLEDGCYVTAKHISILFGLDLTTAAGVFHNIQHGKKYTTVTRRCPALQLKVTAIEGYRHEQSRQNAA